jgi:hypothetical protein
MGRKLNMPTILFMGIFKFLFAVVAALAATALLFPLNGAAAGMVGLLAFFTIMRK